MAEKKKVFRKYIKRGWHIVTRSIEACIAFCFVLSIMLFLRLLKGPIEIDFFTPILEKVLVQKDNQKVSVGMVYLELDAKRGHLCAVKAENIVIKNENEKNLVEIPKASFAFDLLPLLTGNFIPSSLVLDKPYLVTSVNEHADARGLEDKVVSEGVLSTIGKLFLSLKDLDYFEIKKGNWIVDIKSIQKTVSIPDVSFSIKKRGKFSLDFSGAIVLQEGNDLMPFGMQGVYHTNTNVLLMDVSFEDMPIKKFGTLLREIKGIDVVLNGTLNAVLDMNAKTLSEIVKNLTITAEAAQKGTIYLPKPIDTTYFVDTLVFTGVFSEGLKNFEISDAVVTIKKATVLAQMKIAGIDTLLNTGKMDGVFITLKTQAKNVSLSELPVLWPSQLGVSAYNWVTANMKTGTATDASFTFLFQDRSMVDLKGTVNVKNATVDYLKGLPSIKKVDAIVSFFPDKILIEATKGHIGNIKLEKANLSFLNLDEKVVPLRIIFTAGGPVKEGLDILSKKPLELVNFLNLDYKKMKGKGKATVQLDIPISEQMSSSDIGVRVNADLEDISVPVPYTELVVSKGSGTLYADNKKVNIKGHVLFDDNPFEIEWDHLFGENIKTPAKGVLIGNLSDKLLKPYYENISDFIKGDISVRAEVLFETPAFQKINIVADLKNANVFLDALSYVKEKDKSAVFSTTVETGNGKILAVPAFQFDVPDEKTRIDGSVVLKDGIALNLKHIKTSQNDLSVFFEKKSENMKVVAEGKKLNLSKFLHPEDKSKKETSRQGKTKNFDIKIQLDELILTKGKAFKNVRLSIARDNGIYTQWNGEATAVLPIVFKKGKGNRLYVETKDFGSFLNYSGYSDRIRSGDMKLEMIQEKSGLTGKFEMENYALTKTPFFMQAITILGVLDAFKGDEISFKKANIPFRIEENFDILIEDALVYGTAVGVTFRGSIKSEDIALSGSVIPAYAVNSLPGKIPLIGRIFSGDKGGGLIGLAFEINGQIANPELIFKPSSLLTPGFIRNIYN